MEIRYNVTGEKRKELVKTISAVTGAKSKYMGMPSAAYEIDGFTVTKDGTLVFDDAAYSKEVEILLEAIAEVGFECEEHKLPIDAINIEMPRDYYKDAALENLKRIIKSKETLIKKAIGTDALPIEVTEEKVIFPWFTDLEPEALHAYAAFVHKLSRMAKEATRVTASEKETENEKYAFRCFLLRLGFIGDEYKADRKILLKNLSGSSAFKNGHKQESDMGMEFLPTSENTVKIDLEEAKERLKDPEVQKEIRAILNGEEVSE